MAEGNENNVDKDIEEINKELEAAKNKLVDKDIQDKIDKAKAEAKAEAEKELEIKRKLEEQEKTNKELNARLEAQQKESAEKLEILKKKVDDVVSSKAAISVQDPFKSNNNTNSNAHVDGLSEDEINNIEEASARAFWGDDAYDEMMRGSDR